MNGQKIEEIGGLPMMLTGLLDFMAEFQALANSDSALSFWKIGS